MKPDDVERALAGARQERAATAWREPGELRRIARRRKHIRLGGTIAAVVVVATAVTVAVVPNGSSRQPVRIPQGLHVRERSGAAVELVADTAPLGADPKAADAVAQAEQAFGLALLQQTNKAGGPPSNVVLSPSSLAIALSMLQTGAAGKTRDEIARVLHTSGLTSAQQDAGWGTLTTELAQAGKKAGISLQSANSLWLQQNLPMQPAFMAAMARYFDAGTWQVDFQRNLSGAAKAINDWAAKHTNGKITKLFDKGAIDRLTVAVLANAVYLKAAWQYQFDPKLTVRLPFRLTDGSDVTTPFMVSHAGSLVTQTQAYDAAQLPYAGGRFAALVVMPKQQDLASFVSGLTVARLTQISRSLTEQTEELQLPSFTTSSYTRLNETLAAMGMPSAFSNGAANFSAMSPVGLRVQSAVQRAYLRVDEQGTEAAAVTGISMIPMIAAAQITFDRPFLFLVRDTKTGTIMFAAQVQNPAAS